MRRKRKVVAILLLALIILMAVSAIYQDVTTRWVIATPNSTPEISLTDPADDITISANTTSFNWSSSDGDLDPLTHLWYFDIVPTMSSPFLQTHNTGATETYTPSPVIDGVYYWKVEVSDGENVNSSETWTVTFKNYVGNTFPSISNYSLTTGIGSTTTVFYYQVTYTDTDNNTPTSVQVHIDGTGYEMLEVEHFDDNYTDGKKYYYDTTLPLGVHNYSFYISDGYSMNATTVFEGPVVVPVYNHPPEINLISPIPGQIFTTVNITFLFNVTDEDDDLDYSELWLWKGELGDKQVYSAENGTYMNLYSGTYFWQIHAVDEYTENVSMKRSFGVLATGKQCSVTIQPDETTSYTGSTFSGNLVITNEGPLDSYEVYWYVSLWDNKMVDRYSTDSGAMAVSTTSTVNYEVSVPEILLSGKYRLQAFAYDSSETNGTLIGYDQINVTVIRNIVTVGEEEISWNSLVYDTPRYLINLNDYPNASRIQIPTKFNYSFLLFAGTRALKSLELYYYSDGAIIELTTQKETTNVYSFDEISEEDCILIVIPNPSFTDTPWLMDLIHEGKIMSSIQS